MLAPPSLKVRRAFAGRRCAARSGTGMFAEPIPNAWYGFGAYKWKEQTSLLKALITTTYS